MHRRALLAILTVPLVRPAFAQAAVFPPGSAVGLLPPAGMRPADGFTGFQDSGAGASVLIAELPPAAYAAISTLDDAAFQQRQNITVTARRALKLADAGAQAMLLTGTQRAGGVLYRKYILLAGTPALTAVVTMQVPDTSAAYPGRLAEATMQSVAFRPAPSLDEKVRALPFTLRDMAGFRVSQTLAGNGLILTEGPLDVVRDAEQPVMVVVFQRAPEVPPGSRDAFARSRLNAARLADPAIVRNEGFTLRGGEWHVIEANGNDAGTGRAHYTMQVLRFVPGGFMQALGIARVEGREALAPRFRRTAEGMEPR